MLQSIRAHAQGWIAGIIVGLICLTFALFGINSYVSSSGTVNVAVINGEDIPYSRFQAAYQQYRRQLQAILGEQASINDLDQDLLKTEALRQMVDAVLLEQLEAQLGMRSGGGQVAAAISSFQAFQNEDGSFSSEKYQQVLRNLGMSAAQFEAQMGKDLTNEQLRQGISETAFVTEQEARQLAALKKQKRSFGYTVISAESFIDSVSFTDSDVENFYQLNSQQYMTTETVNVDYVLLSLDELVDGIEVTDDEISDYYTNNPDDFTRKEQRSANHILVHVDAEADEDAIEDARLKAEALRQRAVDGEDFIELAKEHSDDVGSAAEGGATGYFANGMLIPGFDDKVFEMQPGQISEPVKTTFGWHIIRLNDIQAAGIEPLEDVREQIIQTLQRKEAETLYYEKYDQMGTVAFENPDALDPIADALGVEIRQSPELSRNSDALGLFAEPKLIAAAFNPDFLADTINSEVIELPNDRLVVMNVTSHKPSELKPLDEVREEVEQGLRLELAGQAAARQGEEILQQLKDGSDRETVIDAAGYKWQSVEEVDRDNIEVKRAVLRAAFRMPAPESDSVIYEGVSIGSGDYTVVGLSKVIIPDDLKKLELKEAEEELMLGTGSSSWVDFVSELRARSDIQTYPDRL